jgi:hypothetical protein
LLWCQPGWCGRREAGAARIIMALDCRSPMRFSNHMLSSDPACDTVKQNSFYQRTFGWPPASGMDARAVTHVNILYDNVRSRPRR